MKNLLLLLSAILFISCSTEQAEQKNIQPEIDEVVDLRIFQDGEVRLNGEFIGESGLKSHIKSLNITESTRARLIFDETVYSQAVFHTQKMLYTNGITNIHTKMLSSEEFKHYNQNKIHIDVLSSGKILFKGNEIYPEDLNTALSNIEVKPETEFIISVSNQAQMGSVFDVQNTLATNNLLKISHEDISKYHH